MKTREVFYLTVLFVFGFFMSEFFVDHLVLFSPLQRFIARVGIQLVFYGLIYVWFDSRDISRRINRIEQEISEEHPGDGENQQ
ncbi:hypothetical protein LLG96_03680 [bacterium]|nr:hypothetical protein [bacterium]